MIIIGAKGFAKEVLEILHQLNQLHNIVFFDDINLDLSNVLYDKFPILRSISEAEDYFKNIDNKFTIGIGNPMLRKKIYDKFKLIGGNVVSTISENAILGSYEVEIGRGSNILAGSIFSNSVKTGIGCIVYYNSILTHDTIIGDFVEISPNVTVLGRVRVGSYTQLGANSTILPNIEIGKNVIIGAGSVVTRNVPDNCVAFGVPAKIIKQLPHLKF